MDSQILSPLSTPNQQQKQTTSPSSLTKPSSITRRVPPPCWTHEETSALIESYHEKWYSLRRGNLRASHWEEVADAVARRCNLVVPSKTSVQCRHKVEKLRKRYRTEVQKSLMTPAHHRFSSSWVFFKRMDLMEKGPSSTATGVDEDEQGGGDEEEEEEDDDDEEQGGGGEEEDDFRSRLRSASGKSSGGGGSKGKRKMDPVEEMVSAVRSLGEGFMRMEQMKLEMAREVEKMRMDMELKRTEMILDSQQKIVDAFAKGFSAKKKTKKMSSPPDS
ncbi:hypothetical protein MKW92_017270 [Papaver armeniacum]|nr:hypothetical protein MKW92_017270 [Papaver armeniacum]